MDTQRINTNQNGTRLRLVSVFILVFILSISNMGAASLLLEVEMDKIEKLAEGECDIDGEEKEKTSEAEEDSFFTNDLNGFNTHLLLGNCHPSALFLSIGHLRITTPPPDLLL